MIQVSSSYAFHGKASEDLKDRRKRVKQGSRAAHILTEEKKKKKKKVGVLTAAQSLFFFPSCLQREEKQRSRSMLANTTGRHIRPENCVFTMKRKKSYRISTKIGEKGGKKNAKPVIWSNLYIEDRKKQQ